MEEIVLDFAEAPHNPRAGGTRTVTPTGALGTFTIWGPAIRGDIDGFTVTTLHEIFHGTKTNIARGVEDLPALESAVETQARSFAWRTRLVARDTTLTNGYLGCTRYPGHPC